MADIPIAAMKAIAERLGGLGLDYAFLGGSVVGLLLDHPELSPVRATADVDVVLEVVSQRRYAGIEERLRALKFDHDTRHGHLGAVVLVDLTADIMPAEVKCLGLNTDWFREALSTAAMHLV